MATSSDEPSLLYDEHQQLVLAILPMISGPMSMIGSLLIVNHIVLAGKVRLKDTYHRLLLVMSVVDFFSSFNLALSTLMIPRGTPGFRLTAGNQTTCNVSGVMTMMGIAFPLYSASLAIHFLLAIRYRVKQNTVTRYAEPVMHVFAICMPGSLAVYALSIDFFAPNFVDSTWCWYGYGCSERDESCLAAQNEKPFTQVVNIFGSIVLFSVLFIVATSMTLIYKHVRAREDILNRYPTPGGAHHHEKSKEAAKQAFLYTGAFLATIGPALVREIIRLFALPALPENRSFFFYSGMITNFLFPMQGFWNGFIYFRPRYRLIRRRHTDLGRLESMKRAIFVRPRRHSRGLSLLFSFRNVFHTQSRDQGSGSRGSPRHIHVDSYDPSSLSPVHSSVEDGGSGGQNHGARATEMTTSNLRAYNYVVRVDDREEEGKDQTEERHTAGAAEEKTSGNSVDST